MWCNGWTDLDARFPASFERYCWGRSRHGEYALPKTLEILHQHNLVGVFFIEALFSARFGAEPLQTMAGLIGDAGQDIQLHLHPEWTDEISPPPITDVSRKRQHLTYYSVDEQSALIGVGRRLLETASGRTINAFRAGSFAANRDTYIALRRNGLYLDSSLNAMADFTGGSLGSISVPHAHRTIEGVQVYPVTVFRDGFGRPRPAQFGASSLEEMKAVLMEAVRIGCTNVVLVSHNFEMLRPGSSEPDWTVVRRFEGMCAWLAQHGDLFEVGPLAPSAEGTRETSSSSLHAPALATLQRHVEQLRRRIA